MSRFGPIPTDAVRPTASRIAALARWPMTAGGPTRSSNPETSRYASSMETFSTTGEMPSSAAMTCRETRA